MSMPERRAAAETWREYRHDSGEVLSFRFTRSARKTLAIYINRDASVSVRVPLRVSLAEVALFLRERWSWIQAQRLQFLQNPAPAPFRYRHGETFKHLGQDYVLQVEAGLRDQASAVGNLLKVRLTPASMADEAVLELVIERWQRREALKLFPQRLAECHARMQVLSLPYPELKIRKMRSRWGSCSRSAIITLNLELMRMPLVCIDYVIIHELCHLVEFNHSPRFYELQSRFLPEWKQHKQQLEMLARAHFGL
ncbi:MAG: SprT family zinc-dependent metalloprotease [Pedobacter sp.]|nr:SprT family zinc-dependent metalloprotease [Pedobacter sp.]